MLAAKNTMKIDSYLKIGFYSKEIENIIQK